MSFDPFVDRTARDIRNGLSSAFIEELADDVAGLVKGVAEQWLSVDMPKIYTDYIRNRQMLYQKVASEIRSGNISNPRFQAVLMWNEELFFELHELLEGVWMKTRGEEKMALKGLIQAAGAYVHIRRGKTEAANGLARRARKYISDASAELGFIANLDELIENLDTLTESPPVLKLIST